jgi:hypothetical protein
MPTKNLFFIFLMIISSHVKSQTFLKYQNINDHISNINVKKIKINAQNQRADSITAQRESVYRKKATEFKKLADDKMAIIISDFEEELDKIEGPADGFGVLAYNEQIKVITQKKEAALKDQQLLENEYKMFDYLDRTSGKFNCFFVKNASDAQMFYNASIQSSNSFFLNGSSINFATNGGTISIYNELYVDYAGPVRVGFGALLSNTQVNVASTTADPTLVQKDAIQKLIGGGSNGIVSLSYPLLNIQSNDNRFNVKMHVSPKVGFDIPAVGTSSTDPAYNWDMGMDGSIYYTGVLNVLTFYSSFRFGKIGGSDNFYSNLKYLDKKPFSFNQVSLGFAIASTIRLNWTTYFGNDFVKQTFPHSLSIFIIPK